MVDMVLLQQVSYIAGALGVCVAAIYYMIMVQNTTRTQKIQSLIGTMIPAFTEEHHRRWTNLVFEQQFSSFEEWYLKYGSRGDEYLNLQAINSQFTLLGGLVYEKAIPLETIMNLVSASLIITLWEKIRPVFLFWRELYRDPSIGFYFEYLYGEVKKKNPEFGNYLQQRTIPPQ